MSEPIKQKQPAPTEAKLKVLLAAGDDCVQIVQDQIDTYNLPYVIQKNDIEVSICHGEMFIFSYPNLDKYFCPVCNKPKEGNSKNKTIYLLRSSFSDGELFLNQFITVDPETVQMKSEALKISKTPFEVLVCGETGTGKDLIASSQKDDRKGALKIVNCSGFPYELIESELFGHTRGAFTGAMSEKEGLISSAENGVMFLDEIGDLPMPAQAKLLRAVQYKVIRKVGSNKEESINCKFVCATNKNLRKQVKLGLFREDLYARLSTLELDIKPLRERMCDVIPITESIEGGKEFLSKYGDDLKKGLFDLSLNVRSLQQLVIRFNVLGRVTSSSMRME